MGRPTPSARPPWDRGCVQVYTGDGKGKTTAALGLALRAAGAGLRVFIAQFAKGRHTAELDALERFRDLIEIRQYGTGRFLRGEPTAEDIEAARRGLAETRQAILSENFSLVILDEGNAAAHLGLLSPSDLVALIDARPEAVELVFTGRDAPAEVIERADLVTEMRAVKHYFADGMQARRGIEF
ncbi:MAG: cob(I)yrinic acid a,c-diamide adenosyltransferase [Planctomycetota bacterium]